MALTETGYESYSAPSFSGMWNTLKSMYSNGGGDRGTKTVNFSPEVTGYGYGNALLNQQANNKTLPASTMFTGSFGNNPSLTGIDTSQAWAAQPQVGTPQYMEQTPAWNNMVDTTGQFPQQVIPQAAQQQVIQQPSSPAVNPVLAQQKALGVTQDGILGPITNRAQAISDYQDAIIGGADPATLTNPYTLDATGTESELSAITTPPITSPTGSGLADFFGLGDMTTKDIYSGIGAGAQIGINAYGMFKGLDQMDTRLDQGQQALDLNREEYDENLRHRRAIVAQNKGA